MPVLDRDGVGLAYELIGSATNRPPLLLTHGYSATQKMWRKNVAALSADRQVITWDLRGHGASDSPDDPARYSETLSLDDMVALLDLVGAQKAVIAGLSLGGYLSLAFHAHHADRVAALGLFDTGPGYRRDDGRAQWNTMVDKMAARLEREGLDALGEGTEVRRAEHRSPKGLALAARGILAQRDATVITSLASIAVPTLVLVGQHDKAFLAASDQMAAKIPGARKVVLADAGHAANIDQPAAFDAAVVGFLAEVP
jgi:pimeloyl-ACP methyl ester carboxylesterase